MLSFYHWKKYVLKISLKWSHFKTTQDYVHITPQRYTQVVTGNFARSDYLLFVFPLLIHWQCNHFAKKRYFRETGKIEGNCVTRVRKRVQFSTANWKYELCILYFARYVSRICLIFMTLFRKQGVSIYILHWMYLILRIECIYNAQFGPV